MFGLIFSKSKLTRVLTDYQQTIYPMRKIYTFGEMTEIGYFALQNQIKTKEIYKSKLKFI